MRRLTSERATLLLALRNVAKSLASVPGRKSLVLLTAGFPINPGDPDAMERQSELTAADQRL